MMYKFLKISDSATTDRIKITLIFIFCITLAACGGSDDSDPPTKPVASEFNGIWRLDRTFSATTTTPNNHPLCIEGNDYVYLSVSQNPDNSLTAVAHSGDISNGSIQSDNLFSLSGVKQWTDTENLSNQIAVSYSGTTDGQTMNGTYSEVYSKNGNIICDREMAFAGSFVYKPTGNENYSAMYATESNTIDVSHGVSLRDTSTLQLEVNGANDVTVYSIDNVSTSNSTYSPATGAATFTLTWSVTTKDYNGDNIPDNATFTENHSILFIRAPDDSSGQPVIIGSNIGSSTKELSNNTGSTSIVNGDYARTYYSRPLTSTSFTRANLVPTSGRGNTLYHTLGIANPPIKGFSSDSNSTVGVDNGLGTVCNAPYHNKFQQIVRIPFPDMSNESFSTGFYSLVSCSTSSTNSNAPLDNTTYDISIANTTGANATFAVTTQITDSLPTILPNRRAINVNGAYSSVTRRGDSIPIFGFFDVSQDIPFDWNISGNSNIDQYQLRFKLDNDATRDYRIITKATTGGTLSTNTILPKDTLLKIAD